MWFSRAMPIISATAAVNGRKLTTNQCWVIKRMASALQQTNAYFSIAVCSSGNEKWSCKSASRSGGSSGGLSEILGLWVSEDMWVLVYSDGDPILTVLNLPHSCRRVIITTSFLIWSASRKRWKLLKENGSSRNLVASQPDEVQRTDMVKMSTKVTVTLKTNDSFLRRCVKQFFLLMRNGN